MLGNPRWKTSGFVSVMTGKRKGGELFYGRQRDVLSELDRLEYVRGVPSPKTSQHFVDMANIPIHLTEEGKELLEFFARDKAVAYDNLFSKMYQRHPYLQAFVSILGEQRLFAPVISSMKEHVSDRYTSTMILAEDVSKGVIDVEVFIRLLSQRIKHGLREEQTKEIREAVIGLLQDTALKAAQDDLARFAKMFMEKLNHLVIPALFREKGIGFDYRTHRALWSMGEEFRLWCTTRSHPDYDGWLVYPTATIKLSDDRKRIAGLIFDTGLANIRERFLSRLHDAYQKLQSLRGTTFVTIWELRAVFCVDNRCQRSVFDRVFGEKLSRF